MRESLGVTLGSGGRDSDLDSSAGHSRDSDSEEEHSAAARRPRKAARRDAGAAEAVVPIRPAPLKPEPSHAGMRQAAEMGLADQEALALQLLTA